jgi:hypothetical protein
MSYPSDTRLCQWRTFSERQFARPVTLLQMGQLDWQFSKLS